MSGSGSPVLIDSSVWIEALNEGGDHQCRTRVSALLFAGKAAICEVVIAEVLRGADDAQEASQLGDELRDCIVLPSDGMGSTAAMMGRELGAPRARLADLLIAAVALENGVSLMTRDRHLARICKRFGIDEAPV